MQQELLIAVIAGLSGMLGWGFADFFAKKTIDEIGDIASLVWAHVFGTLGFALVAIYQYFVYKQNVLFPTDPFTWGLLAFFGALQAVVYLLVYKGFGKGQLAVLNPIFASYSGITALISILVFAELVTGHALLALATIFIGVILISLDMAGLRAKKLNFHSGVKEVSIAALLAALWTLGWDKFIGGQDWITFALLMYLFMTLTAFLFAKAKRVNLKFSKKPQVRSALVMIGLCEMVAYLGISLGFSQTSHTSIVAVLSGAFSLPTILLARIFLKEKVAAIQTIGSIVIILGIVALAVK